MNRTLLRIPDVIIEAEHLVDTFPPDATLSEKAERLYLAILGAIEGAAKWLNQRPLGDILLLLLVKASD